MASEKLTHNDYTVGWVCALPKEQTAATAMLNHRHDDLPKPPSDHNTYTLGRIGNHNIVIACLPKGEIGTNSAATVAIRMTSTFPSIKFGLLVGIGGGVPPVRLGDVVVSTPTDGFSGVVQWDMGKAEQGNIFKRTGALNNPPSALLTALTRSETKHEMNGSKIPQYLEDIKTNWPRLVAKYTRSESLEDVLFKSNYNHVNQKAINNNKTYSNIGNDEIEMEMEMKEEEQEEEEEEETENGSCKYCDRAKVIKRKPRGMKIHYGLIASGNQVIKDATFRNEIKARLEGNVLCFEMEAAGLTNDFPCIVIRGICDYADSHKNKVWQEHAAAVAAAFGKEFLLEVPVYEVVQLPAITDILNGITHLSADVAQLKQAALSDEYRKILGWLSKVDPSLNYRDARKRRTPSTGNWLLKSHSYLKWKEGDFPILWLHGIPGCGKTIISSTVIDELCEEYAENPNTCIAYFYFNFNDAEKQSVDECMLSLLKQLSAEKSSTDVNLLYKQHHIRGIRPDLDMTMTTLKAVLQQFSQTVLVLDALDECKDIETLMKKVSEINKWEMPGLSVLATSRRVPSITKEMESIARSVCLETKLVDEDIRTFVKQSLRNDGCLQRWSKDAIARKEIEDALTARSNGMFRWVECQIEALRKCLSRPMLREALVSLPKSLDETYARILCNIAQAYSQDALKILQWLAFSEQPPSIEELIEVIAVNTEGSLRFDPNNRIKEPQDILILCSSLVTTTVEPYEKKRFNERRKTIEYVRLAHFSVKEYLVSDRIQIGLAKQYSIQGESAHAAIAQICLSYLLQFDEHDSLVSETTTRFPLTTYAVTSWIKHAQDAGRDDSATSSAYMKLFLSRYAYRNWVQLYDEKYLRGFLEIDEYPDESLDIKLMPAPLYFASMEGLAEAVRLLIKSGADVNMKSGFYGSALQAASVNDSESNIEQLLEEVADADMKGGHYSSALQAASAYGHESVIQQLLEAGADVNIKGGAYSTALQAASRNGHESIVQRLLEAGADVNTNGGSYGSALHAASAWGHESIIQQLLEAGADVDMKAGSYGTALYAALRNRHDNIVQRLLEAGADVNMKEGPYGSALHFASSCGRESIIQQLLEAGADVNMEGGHYGSALQAASLYGYESTVQWLLEAGADVNMKAGPYGSALQAASVWGYESIVQRLLEAGADVNIKGGVYGSALRAASADRHESIVQRLLEAGADVNMKAGPYGNALQAASVWDYESIVQRLLEAGAINSGDIDSGDEAEDCA